MLLQEGMWQLAALHKANLKQKALFNLKLDGGKGLSLEAALERPWNCLGVALELPWSCLSFSSVLL